MFSLHYVHFDLKGGPAIYLPVPRTDLFRKMCMSMDQTYGTQFQVMFYGVTFILYLTLYYD